MSLLVFAVLTLPKAALAYDGHTPIYFFSVTTCGQFAEDRKEPTRVGMNGADYMYVAGWLTASNLYVKGPMFLTDGDVDSALLWLDQYCAAHPFESLQSGLIQVVQQRTSNSH